MKIYVAGKWQEKPRVSALMRQLEEMGCTITYDWTKVDEATAKLHEQASLDIDAVFLADLVVVLWHPGLRGGLVEMGAALVDDATAVWAVGVPDSEPCIFFKHPKVKHLAHEDDVLRGIALAASISHAEIPSGIR